MNNLSLFGIFIEGLLSFLSPCVLPLVPLYISYLGGEKYNNRKDIIINTFLFVLGIVLTFIIFGMSISFFREHILKYQEVISIIGGAIIIFFALHELGIINISTLNKEFSLKDKLKLNEMTRFKAFLFGFIFSFAWSPCIGPMLGNALLLSSTESAGILYLVLYALGLIIPFIITGLFASTIINLINNKKDISKYVVKIAGIIMLCFGLYMIYNASKTITNYKNLLSNQSSVIDNQNNDNSDNNDTQETISVLDYKYKDNHDNIIDFDNYKGKYVYLNFIATWCTYCRQEIPSYLEFGKKYDDVVNLYVMSPLITNETDVEGIKKFIDEQEIDIPVIIDEDGTLLYNLGVTGFPTMFVVGPEKQFLGYLSGMLTEEGFDDLRNQAIQIHESTN